METLVLIRISTLDLLGISTNALIFYLLFRHRASSNGRPSDLFTLTISLVDILYILLADGLETISALGFVPEKWLRSMMHVPYYTFCLVPQLLLLCRTYCHYLAICNPFKFRQFVTRKNVSRCIIYAGTLGLFPDHSSAVLNHSVARLYFYYDHIRIMQCDHAVAIKT